MSAAAAVVLARRALLSNAVAVGVSSARLVALSFLTDGPGSVGAVRVSADALRTLRSSYRLLRRGGCSPARLAVVARYGSFFAAVVDGQTAVEFPGRHANAVVVKALSKAFAPA